jgi:alpha-methylacyl-CoA racemase
MKQPETISTGPLAGLRVLEIESIGPVPWACMMLSNLGAQVIRIERPVTSELNQGLDPKFQLTGQGREKVPLDLKTAPGIEAALRLVSHADVLLEGMRPGVMERLGLGPQICHDRNPKLVYGRMTGWGQSGPLAQTAAHDINYIGLTGVLHAIGPRHGMPIVPLNLMGDFGGGAMLLLFGVLAALLESRNSGKGQVVDAAIVDGCTAMLAPIFGRLQSGQWLDQRESNLLDGGAPFYGTYATADGRYVAVGAIETPFYADLLRGLGLDAQELPLQHDRSAWPVLRERFAQVFNQRTRDEWCAVFSDSQACVTPVLSLNEAAVHPHQQARQAFVEIDGVAHPAPAPRFSRTPGHNPTRASCGRNTQAALIAWGLMADDPLVTGGKI